MDDNKTHKDEPQEIPFEEDVDKKVDFDKPVDVVRKMLYYFIPKVKSYDDLKNVLKQLGFNIRDKYDSYPCSCSGSRSLFLSKRR